MVLNRLFRIFRRDEAADLEKFRTLFERFQQILTSNNRILEIISQLEDKLSGEYIFGINYIEATTEDISEEVRRIISNLNLITGNRYPELYFRQSIIEEELKGVVANRPSKASEKYVIDFDKIDADISASVGGKISNLGEIKNRLEMAVPDGFVLTTASYRRFMEYNDLWSKIRDAYTSWPPGGDRKNAERYDGAIDDIFGVAQVPPDVSRSVSRHLGALYKRCKREVGVSVRSSACGEDTEKQSFAGQFKSFLNCRGDDVYSAYIKVIASRFKNTVAVYAGDRFIQEEELPMAVGVQETIPARSAGVLYSVDPASDSRDSMTISACFGLGVHVVEGTVNADYFRVSRLDPTQITDRRIGSKKTKLVLADPKGTQDVTLQSGEQTKSSLTDDQVIALAKEALLLERHFKRPVDVEWCVDDRGELYILQCRPLRLPAKPQVREANLKDLLAKKTIIMRNKGTVAQRGIAAGKVWHIEEMDDPEDFPIGAIAVTKQTTPRLTSIIRKAGAIVTDVGSSSGHMATVAREFGVPMIVDAGDVTNVLATGQEVTVDAEENTIYEGIVSELLEYELAAEDVFRDLKEYKMLRRILRKIAPLSLIDPASAAFSTKNCRTYHDIVRFTHEKAVQFLTNLNISSHRFRGIKSKRLQLPIPLGLSVVDLGGGLRESANADKVVSVDAVESTPLNAILEGLLTPGIWSTQPSQLGFGDLVSSMTRYKMTDRTSEYQGTNLAVISGSYMNMSLRLGYHFNVIDTYVTENAADNYIYFRFVGGVTENERRHLRALAIREILAKLNFKVTVNGDLVVARLKQWEATEISRVLREIGRLIGFTRQLDTQMQSQESVHKCFRAFFGENVED